MEERTATSGFLIEETFPRMYREFMERLERGSPHLLDKAVYSSPRRDTLPEQMPRQYRGLHRLPIQGWVEGLRGSGVVEPTEQELEASLFLAELEDKGRADQFIYDLRDAEELVRKIVPPVEREIIWARRMDVGDPPAPGTALLGYEPSSFYPPYCNSAVAEGFFFPVWLWVPEYKESVELRAHHARLNKWGLFDTPSEATEYLESYLPSLPADWDERRYRYYVVEVRVPSD